MSGKTDGMRRSLSEIHEQSMQRTTSPTASSWPKESALTADELKTFFESNRYAVLATTRRDGRPHAAPVAYLIRDERVWVASVEGAVRLRNLEHQSRATLVVTRGDGDHHVAVTIEGSAELHDAEAESVSWIFDAWPGRFGTVLDWAGTIIELIPERVLSYGHGRVNGSQQPSGSTMDDPAAEGRGRDEGE